MMGAFLRLRIGSPSSLVVSVSIKALVHFSFLFAKVEEDGEAEESCEDGGDVII